MTANEYMKKIKDNLDSVEQNLEQIQCDDCISRQAVLGCLTATKLKELKKYDLILHARGEIKNLPSVTPKNTVSVEAYKQVMWERDIAIQQLNELGYEFGEKIKTGHWIESKGYDIRDHFYVCSECGRYINLICGAKLSDYPYCHCGAKMVEPQESEEV